VRNQIDRSRSQNRDPDYTVTLPASRGARTGQCSTAVAGHRRQPQSWPRPGRARLWVGQQQVDEFGHRTQLGECHIGAAEPGDRAGHVLTSSGRDQAGRWSASTASCADPGSNPPPTADIGSGRTGRRRGGGEQDETVPGQCAHPAAGRARPAVVRRQHRTVFAGKRHQFQIVPPRTAAGEGNRDQGAGAKPVHLRRRSAAR